MLSFDELIASKQLSADQRRKDISTLKSWAADTNMLKFCGNRYLYHYQIANLCKTRYRNRPSLYEKLSDPTLYAALYRSMESFSHPGLLATRILEAHRFNGAVVFFKPAVAKFLFKHYGATRVLDPTAGWGGRMLGAHSLGISYTGIDTNLSLKPAYDAMITELRDIDPTARLTMLWGSCLDVDFSTLDYDFVLTSPPYINLERYEHMTPFKSTSAYYNQFLIPLLHKCLAHIRPGGRVCFNISPQMYDMLMTRGFRACDETHALLQRKRLGRSKGDLIYIWRAAESP